MSLAVFLRLALLSLILFKAVLVAAPMVSIGTHPTSPLTSYPRLRSLRAFEGKIYMGYGDYDYYPAVTISSYDPAAHCFTIEHSASTDSIERLRVVNGNLYAPSTDPIHYEDFKDVSYKKAGQPWRDTTAIGALHVYDVAAAHGRLYLAGAGGFSGVTGSALYQSADDGKTWTLAATSAATSRFYWCYALQGKVYVEGLVWDGATSAPSHSFSLGAEAKTGTVNGTEFALINTGGALRQHFAGSAPTAIRYGPPLDFAWVGNDVYTLEGSLIYRGTFTSPTNITWVMLPITSVPGGATCMEVLNGKVYVGTSNGGLYVANVDGTTLPDPGAASVVNALPDQFGRGLAWNGSQLITGAPDAAASPVPLGGRVQAWQPSVSGPSNPWTETSNLTAATPDFSGWFGKDVACANGVMAVVESGRDASNQDRGKSAEVHLYTDETTGVWTKRVTLPIPFAHSASIQNGFLAVGSGNPAANQASGLPGVYLYRLSGSGAALTATFLRQVNPVNTSYGYKPVARALLMNNIMVAGFSGDPSRNSAPGLVSIFKKTADGTDFVSNPSQEFPVPAGRHGNSLAADGSFFGVGAPLTMNNSRPTGSVNIYEVSPTNTVTLRSTIPAPVSETNAQFGASIAMANGWLLVGAPGAERNGNRHAGRVFIYRRGTAGNYGLIGELSAPVASEGEFGIEISAGQNYFAIGSRYSDSSAPLHQRIAFLRSDFAHPFAYWASTRNLPAGQEGLEADPDEDGITNFMEYSGNLDPIVFNSPATGPAAPVLNGTPSAQPGSPNLTLSFVRPMNDPHLVVELFGSPNLTTWSPVALTATFQQSFGTYERWQFSIPSTGTNSAYYRLRYRYNP